MGGTTHHCPTCGHGIESDQNPDTIRVSKCPNCGTKDQLFNRKEIWDEVYGYD